MPKGSPQKPVYELATVDAASISFLVNRILKVGPRAPLLLADLQADFTAIVDKKNKEASKKTMDDLVVLQEELSALPELPEVDWSRMRDIHFQEELRGRASLVDRLNKMGCQLCPDFEEHVSSRLALMRDALTASMPSSMRSSLSRRP